MTKHKEVTTAGVIFLTKDGQVVLQRRDAKAPTSPNKLGLFGGHLNRGEGPIDAIVREVHEETSVPLEEISYQFIGKVNVPPSPGHDTWNPFYIFKATLKDEHFRVFEGRGAEKHELKELLRRTDLGYWTKYVLEHMKERDIWQP
jgi:8-oxo-dGTP diphosphatase